MEYAHDKDRSTGQILQDIIAHGQEIIRGEVRLAKAEIKEEATKAGKAAAMFAVGGVCAAIALGFVLWTIAYGLSGFMPMWAATLCIALLLGVTAAVLISLGRKRIQDVNPKPEKTIENVKENIEWAKHQTRS